MSDDGEQGAITEVERARLLELKVASTLKRKLEAPKVQEPPLQVEPSVNPNGFREAYDVAAKRDVAALVQRAEKAASGAHDAALREAREARLAVAHHPTRVALMFLFGVDEAWRTKPLKDLDETQRVAFAAVLSVAPQLQSMCALRKKKMLALTEDLRRAVDLEEGDKEILRVVLEMVKLGVSSSKKSCECSPIRCLRCKWYACLA